MRVAAHVMGVYLLLVVLGAVWRHTPMGDAVVDVVALSAVYLGLTARDRVAPAVAGAVIIGYLADLICGGPRGLLALTSGTVCVLGHVAQGRLLVRGRLYTAVLSSLVALSAGCFVLVLRYATGIGSSSMGAEMVRILLTAAMTGAAGPVVFSMFRRLDARFARTQRERDAALEGLLP